MYNLILTLFITKIVVDNNFNIFYISRIYNTLNIVIY